MADTRFVTDGRMNSAILICHPKFLPRHEKFHQSYISLRIKDRMANSVDPDDAAHDKPFNSVNIYGKSDISQTWASYFLLVFNAILFLSSAIINVKFIETFPPPCTCVEIMSVCS